MEEILGVGPSGWDHFLHAGVEGEPAEKRVRLEPEKEEDKNEPVIVTAAMVAEEEQLKQQRELLDLQKQRKAKEKELAENEETEQRLKRLEVLLKKSSFFSKNLAKKVEDQNAGKLRKNYRAKDKQLLKDKAMLDARSGEEKQENVSEGGGTSGGGGTRVTSMGIEVSGRQPFLVEGACMRDYQLEGFEWLKLLHQNGINGILADEMGLGKTVQAMALICHLIENKVKGPFLIVAPLSTLPNWINEFNSFAPRVPTLLYHGPDSARKCMVPEMKVETVIEWEGVTVKSLPVVVTSYEVAMRDLFVLHKMHFGMIVLDEGHRIKNHQCRLGRELRLFKSKSRMILTGTPMQNNLQELWSLLNYLLPDVFTDLSIFESWFQAKDLSSEKTDFQLSNQKLVETEQKNHVISQLHQILEPFMLRRMKTDVNLSLPPKKEILVFTPLTTMQSDLYMQILNRTFHEQLRKEREKEDTRKKREEDLKDDRPVSARLRRSEKVVVYDMDTLDMSQFKNRYHASLHSHQKKTDAESSYRKYCIEKSLVTAINPCNIIIDLRKVVNHPYLIQNPLVPGTTESLVDERIVTSAGKMLVLDAMLDKLKSRGHKVLIFSQWVTTLNFVEDLMELRSHTFCRLDGNTKMQDRLERIARFNTDPEVFAFLLTTRAGGLGINLTAADTVIIYDSDWNPQSDLQAQDRCHRIGQTKPVVVYRLTADGTIDRQMVERAAGKRRLEKMIMKRGHFAGQCRKRLDATGEFSAEELLKLLSSKDYSREVQSNGFVFTEEELEALLDRSDMVSSNASKKPLVETQVYKVV